MPARSPPRWAPSLCEPRAGGGEISGYGPGFFLAFASSPGATALDGNGARNSPFTAALVHHLDEEPGANLRDLFDGVKSTVSEIHGAEQVPWVNDSLNRQHVKVLAKLNPSAGTPLPPTAMSEAEIEKRARELAAKMAAEAAMRNTPSIPPAIPAAPQAPLGGKGFTNSLGMKFVAVPGTQVLMCVHETRNADYAAYAAAQGGVDAGWKEAAGSGKEQHPVMPVSYEEAEEFCRWLSAEEGRTYRLPTDAEWSAAVGLQNEHGRTPEEKQDNRRDERFTRWLVSKIGRPPAQGDAEWSVAVGLGSETGRMPTEKDQNGPGHIFPWGSYYPPKPEDGNYDVVDNGYEGTSPVMSFRANELGIHDLGGNVWEWCQDFYGDSREDRVLRGASWYGSLDGYELLSSYRQSGLNKSLMIRGDYGFRCVLDVAGGNKTSPPAAVLPPPSSNGYPTAKRTKPGLVESPFAPGRMIDVRDLRSGEKVRCPYSQKVFLVP